jgi:hypothetical protein
MTATGAFSRFLAPRSYMPKELRNSRIGCTDMGSLALAHAIKNRIERGRYKLCHVFVDIDSCVYAVMKPGAWLEWTLATHPEMLIGVYTKGVDAGNLAADFEDLRCAA